MQAKSGLVGCTCLDTPSVSDSEAYVCGCEGLTLLPYPPPFHASKSTLAFLVPARFFTMLVAVSRDLRRQLLPTPHATISHMFILCSSTTIPSRDYRTFRFAPPSLRGFLVHRI